uniref:hypothetical protein n=1 Tax=Fodinicola feengrottensis TaxID=435914 RepID=UPI0024433181|nr:hypothetical protein [Fodinicola feengrottensis]
MAPAIGPTISGILLNLLGWRAMFWTVLPIALVTLVIGVRQMKTSASRATRPSTSRR